MRLPAAIEVQGLVKRYGGRAVVDGASFAVQPGEVFALLGPNGAGKTTTVEVLEGYRVADAGTVRVLGLDPGRQAADLRPQMGLMLQQGGIYPQLTAREAVRLFASFYAQPDDPATLLERVGLAEAADTRFRYLSGGQKQRLSLALALVGRPRVAFLDEPTAAMDPEARRVAWSVVRDLQRRGCTVLLTTHLIEEAEQLADRVAIMSRGRIVALDTPDRLRQGAAQEVRLATDPPVQPAAVARALDLPLARVRRDGASLMLEAAPTPALVARLAGWLAAEGVLLTQLSAGARSLEQAYLDITREPSLPAA